MTKYASPGCLNELTAICVVDGSGSKIAEAKVPTDPDAMAWPETLQGSVWKPARWRSGFEMN